MKAFLKHLPQQLRLYHPLQYRYRRLLFLRDRAESRAAYRRYKGTGFTCNSCGARYARFVPFYPSEVNRPALEKHAVVAGYGDHVFCPHCRCTSRDRLILAVLQQRTDLRGKQVLHLAPEKPVYDYLKGKAAVTTADYEPGFYHAVDPNILYANLEKLPFPDASFDLVIANHVLEHVPDDHTAMRELYRVLKRGGDAILQVPFSTKGATTWEEPHIKDPDRQAFLFGQCDHVRIYALPDYLKRLRTAGFTVEYLDDAALLSFQRFAIQPGEGFIVIRKEGSGKRAATASEAGTEKEAG